MNFNLKQLLRSLALAMLLLLPGSLAFAGDAWITANGQGVNRQAAIHDALRMAVENKAGVMLDSKTLFENARILEDTIYARAEGFVRSYDVVDEAGKDGAYRVTIRAIVDTTLDMELMSRFQKIKAVETGLQDPRIGVMIVDKNTYDDMSGTAENAIVKALLNNGFSRLIDTKQIDQARKQQIASALLYNNTEEAAALMSQFAVDYMIVGDVESSAQGIQRKGFGNFSSGRAIINYRIFNMNTAEIAYADTADASEIDTNAKVAKSKAVACSADKAGKSLVNGLLSKATNPLQTIQVMVSSSHSITEVQDLLRDLSGIQQVYLRDSRQGFMIFDVNCYGSVDTIIGQLERQNVDVAEVSSKYVKISY